MGRILVDEKQDVVDVDVDRVNDEHVVKPESK